MNQPNQNNRQQGNQDNKKKNPGQSQREGEPPRAEERGGATDRNNR